MLQRYIEGAFFIVRFYDNIVRCCNFTHKNHEIALFTKKEVRIG
jgi:hypothetical protein